MAGVEASAQQTTIRAAGSGYGTTAAGTAAESTSTIAKSAGADATLVNWVVFERFGKKEVYITRDEAHYIYPAYIV